VTVGSLFAGIGGMDAGLERAGMRVVWQVETDPFCETILERHWPAVPRRRDVRFAGRANLARVDLVCGGFPCQDVSAAGLGHGLDGHRSGLWHEFARIVRELRPRWVLVENVPALRGRGADRVLGDLEAAGYTAEALVVGARHVGAPQRRDRVWIVAHTGRAQWRSPRPADGTGNGSEGAIRAGECGEPVADPGGVALRHLEQREPARRADGVRDEGEAVARTDGGVADVDGEGQGDERAPWPAGPQSPQHPWEPPRTTQSRLGRGAHGFSRRLDAMRRKQRLKALGNAVVPACAELIGRAILVVDDGWR